MRRCWPDCGRLAKSNCSTRLAEWRRSSHHLDRLPRKRNRGAISFWLSCNGIIAPVAIITLWILPGPNLIGYWFAYRAIHHSLVVWGIRRVQRKQIPTELYPVAALDLPIEQARGR